MVKTYVLLFTCFVFAVVANAKPSDHESAQPVKNNVIVEEKPRLKRQADRIIQSIGGMVTGIIHEAAVHRRDRPGQQLNIIGQGRGTRNYVKYHYT